MLRSLCAGVLLGLPLVFAAPTLAAPSPVPANGPNLLATNPDFETPGNFGGGHGETGAVPGWRVDYFAYDFFGVKDGGAPSGKRFLGLGHGGRLWTAPEARAPVSPNRVYRMEFDAHKTREENLAPSIGFVPSIQFFDARGELIKDAKGTGVGLGIGGATPWQHFALEAVAPMGAVTAGVQLFFDRDGWPNEDKRDGEVDNFSLREVPETTNSFVVRRAPRQLVPGRTARVEARTRTGEANTLLVNLLLGSELVAQKRVNVPIGQALVPVDVPLPAKMKTSNAYKWNIILRTGRENESIRDAFAKGGVISLLLSSQSEAANASVDLTQTGSGTIAPDNPNLQLCGRWDRSDPKAPKLYWGGSQIRARFAGTSVKALLKVPNGAEYIAVLDGDEDHFLRARVQDGVLSVATGLPDGIHDLMLMKNDEDKGGEFAGLVLDAGKGLLKPEPLPAHRIEFFGDSITSGGSPDPKGDKPNRDNDGDYLGNFNRTYAAFTARALNADWRPISKGGSGVSGSWVFDYTLNDFWDKLDFNTYNAKNARPWDFSLWQPDAVVIAIGHNDGFRKPSDQAWIDAYARFVGNVRRAYPKAEIFCTNTSMSGGDGRFWKMAVLPLLAKDPHVHFQLFTPGQGHGGHPRLDDHEGMAQGNRDWNGLADWIGDTLGW